jgi:hypothetical protein
MSASERLASAVMQGQQHGSVGRWRRCGGGSGRDMWTKIAAGASEDGGSVGRRREKFAAGMQATLIPPPTWRLERERSASQHLTSAATEGTIPPCALEGSSTPGGGEERLVARRQRRGYSAGHFLSSVEAQLRLFVAPTPTRFC